ncbi:MAG: hypothetical protein ACOXZK_08745 [Bacteroidales bacterium]
MHSVFKVAHFTDQYKMLFKDNLIDYNFSNKLHFLITSTHKGREKLKSGKYKGEIHFAVLEKDIKYIDRYITKLEQFYDRNYRSYSNRYSLSSTYNKLKETWISILKKINSKIKDKTIFIHDSIETIHKKILQIDQARVLFEFFEVNFDNESFIDAVKSAVNAKNFNLLNHLHDYKYLSCIQKYNSELYCELFKQNYAEISKIDRLKLWLNDLNPYYNYLEFVQSAWQLSKDERRLLNRRLREYAKDERLQKFIDQIPTAKLIEETEESKTYLCKWRNLYYKNGAIQIFIDKTTATEDYKWEVAQEEWNLLTQEYFNNRQIEDIIVEVDNNNRIKSINGLEDVEVKIVFAKIRKYGTAETKAEVTNNEVIKIMHNVAARNQCINFLARQKSDYNVIDIHELVTDQYGSLRRDVSFIFPIKDNFDNIYLVWESAEFEKSKATHIFKCKESMNEEVENNIKEFIESNYRTRSRLNSSEIEDRKIKADLHYLCRVDHDNTDYQVWEDKMREVMPFLE